MLDQESHVNWAVKRIEQQIHVKVLSQLAAEDAAPKRPIRLSTARPKEAFAESFDEIFVRLASSQDGRNDPAAATPEHFDQLAHLLAHVGEYGSCVGETQLAGSTARKSVGDQRAFVRPPAIDCRFAH